MTDKEIKTNILAEIERLKNDVYNEDDGFDYHGRCALDRIVSFINSLPEEPEFTIDKDVSQMADEFAEREYELDGYERKWLSKGYYHGYMDANKSKPEEPVSEDLGEIVLEGTNFNKSWYAHPELAFKADAKWQKEQFEKDYTDLCNGIATAKGIAVKMAYDKGVADTKEQMVAKAIDGHVTFEFYGLDSKTYGTIVHDPICLDDFGLKDTDKVKVIAIKED